MIRAVLDTNVVISALLFSGPPSHLGSAWQSSRLRPVISAPILDEYIRVLARPKFGLTPAEIRSVVEEEPLPLASAQTLIEDTYLFRSGGPREDRRLLLDNRREPLPIRAGALTQ